MKLEAKGPIAPHRSCLEQPNEGRRTVARWAGIVGVTHWYCRTDHRGSRKYFAGARSFQTFMPMIADTALAARVC